MYKMSIGLSKFFGILLAALLLAALVIGITACDTQEVTPPDDGTDTTDDVTDEYEFTFRGAEEFNDGRTYNVVVYGNKDANNSFTLEVEEVSALSLSGTWEFTADKGYTLTFDDAYDTQVRTVYDTETKAFTFGYILDLGESTGMRNVRLTYRNNAFADVYDGEGLAALPTFTGICYTGKDSQVTLDTRVSLYEDGTCAVFTNFEGCPVRRGTWVFNAEENQYDFTMEDEDANIFGGYTYDDGHEWDVAYTTWDGTVYNWDIGQYGDENGRVDYTNFTAKYDVLSDTYSMVIEAACWGYTERLVTYSPIH